MAQSLLSLLFTQPVKTGLIKWADYCITAVRYYSTGTQIEKVWVHMDDGSSFSSGFEQSRSTVITNLRCGFTYCTILRDEDGRWRKGANVGPVIVEGEIYIRTNLDANSLDNLDALPRF